MTAPGTPDPPSLIGVLHVDTPSCAAVAARLLGAVPRRDRVPRRSFGDEAAPGGAVALPACEFRPRAPFSGPLFTTLETFALAAAGERRTVGVVVEVAPLGASDEPEDPLVPEDALVPIADHVDLALRGPLFGRWPAGRRRTFPSMSGLYVPAFAEELLQAFVRPSDPIAGSTPSSPPGERERHPEPATGAEGAAVYSPSVVAGVVDVRRLSTWERRQARAAGLDWASGSLVAAAVVAAYYGLPVVAVGVSSGPPR